MGASLVAEPRNTLMSFSILSPQWLLMKAQGLKNYGLVSVSVARVIFITIVIISNKST